MNLNRMMLAALVAIMGIAWSPVAVAGDAPALPEGLRGFRGMLVGKITRKSAEDFVLKVERIKKIWKQNKAKDPETAVGKEVHVVLWAKSRQAKAHRETLAGLQVGDRIEVEPFHFEGESLAVVEWLEKVGAPAQ